MRTPAVITAFAALAAVLAASAIPALAQPLPGPPAAALKYSPDVPAKITTPDAVETRIGTLHFKMDSRTVALTGNDNTVYNFAWIDLSRGPLIFEVPPKVLGAVNDTWQLWLTDIGITGPDKGMGGKYLFLPPGYNGAVPSGYHVVRSRTLNLWFVFRGFLVDGSPKPAVELVKKFTKIYPVSSAGKAPPPLNFVDLSSKPFNFDNPADYTFWEALNQVVQTEPTESLDPIRLGFFQSIGIQKGKPFAPDERMRKILTEAAAVGDATTRTIPFHYRNGEAYFYPNSYWQTAFIGGYQFQTLNPSTVQHQGESAYG